MNVTGGFGKYWPKFKIQPVWSLDGKTKISTKKKKGEEEERDEMNKCTLQQKQKQKPKKKKKPTMRNLSEKWRSQMK